MGGRPIAQRRLWAPLLSAALLVPLAAGLPLPQLPPPLPEVALGFALAPLTPLPVATSIAFGPGDGDGDDLYATSLAGSVYRFPLTWTAAGPALAGQPAVIASGFSQPLGLAFGPDGALYVADSTQGEESGRLDGQVTRIDGDERTVVVGALPNGRHNTNNLRFGPDGRLYITNGNPNDNGVDGGEEDVLPLSGAILSVDAAVVSASPALLRWTDESGRPIAADQIAAHPVNTDFRSKVSVLASGFRNVYDVAFGPTGIAYTATNGADVPPSQDAFFRISAPGQDFGYPFCYHEGTPGAAGGIAVTNPTFPGRDCSTVPPADALLGWHVCATGMDIAPAGTFLDSAFVAECGPFFSDVIVKSAADPTHATYNTGHKVARVALDANGVATGVTDFIQGLQLPIDVVFGPDGAMYVADIDALYRVVQLA